MFSIFKKKPKKKPVRKTANRQRLNNFDQKIKQLSTKEDIKTVINEVINSREVIINEVNKVPDSISSLLVDQITSPLKKFILSELNVENGPKQLSINQAVKQLDKQELSSNQAVKQQKELSEVILDIKQRMEMLSQRHLKILNILVQYRESWLDYEEVGKYCSPQLTSSCVRGYIADLINSYRIPIDKKSFGRRSKVKISEKGVKQLAITKLVS